MAELMPTADELAHSVRKKYDEYQAVKKNIRWEVRQEVEKQAEARIKAELVEVSRAVRAAYREGVTKGQLREATRSYTNSKAWNAIWDAAEDVVPVVDRRSVQPEKVNTFELVTDDPKDQGAKYIQAGTGATLNVYTGPDGTPLPSPVAIRLERQTLRGPWRQEPGAEWYDVDDETGEPDVFPEFQSLIDAGWTIEAIEAEYQAKGK